MSRSRKTTPHIYFTVGGEGTTRHPAVITFSVNFAAEGNWQRNVPSSVTVEEDHPGHFIMKGADSAMTRAELTRAFYEVFPPERGWRCKGEDA